MMDGYRLSNRRAQILLFLAVCWSLVPILLTSSVSAQTTFGPESVWDIEEIPFGQFTSCAGEDECVLSIMRAYNAPDGAIAFAKALEGEGFMSGFTETGIVDLVEIVYPTRANDNFQYVLINGSPPLVHVEDMWNLDLSQDSLYPSLILDYPGLNLWAGDNKLQSMEDLSDGGQRFIFSYVLKDGCHACETAGETLVALDFDSLGRYLGPRLLELIPTIEQVEDVSVESRAVGGLIAYIGPDGNIWLISPDGSGNLRITEDALENSAAVHFIQYSIRSWSPDGLFLAYGRYELFGIGQEKEQLMIYDTVAGTVKEIIGGGSNTFNDITWDTSGSAIIFGNGITGFELSCHPAEFDDPASLWSIDINTGELAEIVAPERGLPLSSPVMSPDGRYISFVEADQCEGVGLFAVYDTKNNSYIAWNERVGTYGWTLDGQHIIYDGIEYAGRGPGLTRSNPEGTNHQELTSPEEQVSDQSPLVSPTGDRIAFSRGGLDESGYLTSIGLWVMNVDGSGPRMLSGLGITSYSWSSDGQHMAVGMGESRDGATIFIFEVDIGESYKLGEGMWPAWQPATSGIPPISKARPWLEEKASLIEQLEQLDIPTSLFTIPAFEAYNEDGARELYERVKSQSEEGTLTQQQLEAFARLTLGERGLSQILPAYTSTAATISDISIDTITTILATLRILPWDKCAQQVYICGQIQAVTERTAWRLIRHG
ncbi:MAG TPA: hypothetical protein VFI27_01340, partial [candidate division Zixibacteria bacterium]|nr:hypothetical protein [candidate division Zixibacteria bacterium]